MFREGMETMSSFRVERQYVTFSSCKQTSESEPTGLETEKENGREAKLAEKMEQAARTAAQAEQLLKEAQRESALLREQARKEAAQMIEEAKRQAEALRREEKKHGYTDGRRAAEEEVSQWKEQEQQRLTVLTRQLKDDYDSRVEVLQGEIVELVKQIAGKIINIKLEQSDQTFLNVVGAAMSRFHQNEEITIHLCGEDFRHYSATGSIEKMEQARGRKITLNVNPSMKRGDCVLESETKLADCGVSGQLNRAYELLKEEHEKEECSYGGHAAKVQGSLAEK